MAITRKKITDFVSIIGNVAKTSHYQVNFGGLNTTLTDFLVSKGVDKDFILRESGLRCNSAVIPGSSLATASINGNFMGVQEKMAHSRIFTEMSLQFYVDTDYRMIKFFEYWIDYISNASETEGNARKSDDNYFYRMRYPREYKCDKTNIVKFDEGDGGQIEYTFYGMFPINLSSTQVQYGSSDVLNVNVTFNYERYICGKDDSKSRAIGNGETNKTKSVNPDSSFRRNINRVTPDDARLIQEEANFTLL